MQVLALAVQATIVNNWHIYISTAESNYINTHSNTLHCIIRKYISFRVYAQNTVSKHYILLLILLTMVHNKSTIFTHISLQRCSLFLLWCCHEMLPLWHIQQFHPRRYTITRRRVPIRQIIEGYRIFTCKHSVTNQQCRIVSEANNIKRQNIFSAQYNERTYKGSNKSPQVTSRQHSIVILI